MSSHREIFRSSAITGTATGVSVVIGIVKVKAIALILGPAGIGLMGMYQNILGLASTLAGCGLANSGIRQLAVSTGADETLAIVRRALWRGTLLLGLTGALAVWLIRDQVSQWVFGDATKTQEIGWLGFGVLLSLIASSQTALLRGLRRVSDLARVTIIGAVLAAISGIGLVYRFGPDGVVWFVLVVPAFNILIASYYASRLPRPSSGHTWAATASQWRAMIGLGLPFMAAALFNLATQLVAKSIVLREFGIDEAGYFQAAWSISMTYIGFVLGAMGTDYFPRLTAVIDDQYRARSLVNDQAEMALLLAGPILLAMITLAPWVIHLLYAKSFEPATELLRWQILGDIVKVSSWPMGFVLLAQGRGILYLTTQIVWDISYLVFIFYGIVRWGLVSVGVGFFVAYIILYGLVVISVGHRLGYRPTLHNLLHMLALLASGASILWSATLNTAYMLGIGAVVIAISGAFSLKRLDKLLDMRSWLHEKMSR